MQNSGSQKEITVNCSCQWLTWPTRTNKVRQIDLIHPPATPRTLIDIAGGIDLAGHMQRLQAAMQKLRPTADNLAVVLQNTVQPSLETTWSRLVIPKAQAAQKPQPPAAHKVLISKAPGKLADADLSTFHKKISTPIHGNR